MNDRPGWAPADIDLARPSPARMYDYLLGGSHNFAVDRALAEQAIASSPGVREGALANRAFLRRAVRYMVGAGVRQFIDIGSGIPTVHNTHEVAQGTDPAARVVYVDNDPVAVAHSQAILAHQTSADVLHADLREPSRILAAPTVTHLIDLTRPVGLLLLAVLHFVPDDDEVHEILDAFAGALPSGSHLAISHVTDAPGGESRQRLRDLARAQAVAIRSPAQVARFFARFPLVTPGLVALDRWRPDPDETTNTAAFMPGLAGVGRTN